MLLDIKNEKKSKKSYFITSMNTYNHNLDSKISYVPIYEIGISTPIINAVKKLGDAKLDDYIIDSSAPHFGQLTRLDSFIDFENTVYPPIVLKFLEYQGIYSIVEIGRAHV